MNTAATLAGLLARHLPDLRIAPPIDHRIVIKHVVARVLDDEIHVSTHFADEGEEQDEEKDWSSHTERFRSPKIAARRIANLVCAEVGIGSWTRLRLSQQQASVPARPPSPDASALRGLISPSTHERDVASPSELCALPVGTIKRQITKLRIFASDRYRKPSDWLIYDGELSDIGQSLAELAKRRGEPRPDLPHAENPKLDDLRHCIHELGYGLMMYSCPEREQPEVLWNDDFAKPLFEDIAPELAADFGVVIAVVSSDAEIASQLARLKKTVLCTAAAPALSAVTTLTPQDFDEHRRTRGRIVDVVILSPARPDLDQAEIAAILDNLRLGGYLICSNSDPYAECSGERASSEIFPLHKPLSEVIRVYKKRGSGGEDYCRQIFELKRARRISLSKYMIRLAAKDLSDNSEREQLLAESLRLLEATARDRDDAPREELEFAMQFLRNFPKSALREAYVKWILRSCSDSDRLTLTQMIGR